MMITERSKSVIPFRPADAASAPGIGGNGPSLDASLITELMPSSRRTSSSGRPGSYASTCSSAGLTRPLGSAA